MLEIAFRKKQWDQRLKNNNFTTEYFIMCLYKIMYKCRWKCWIIYFIHLKYYNEERTSISIFWIFYKATWIVIVHNHTSSIMLWDYSYSRETNWSIFLSFFIDSYYFISKLNNSVSNNNLYESSMAELNP